MRQLRLFSAFFVVFWIALGCTHSTPQQPLLETSTFLTPTFSYKTHIHTILQHIQKIDYECDSFEEEEEKKERSVALKNEFSSSTFSFRSLQLYLVPSLRNDWLGKSLSSRGPPLFI